MKQQWPSLPTVLALVVRGGQHVQQKYFIQLLGVYEGFCRVMVIPQQTWPNSHKSVWITVTRRCKRVTVSKSAATAQR